MKRIEKILKTIIISFGISSISPLLVPFAIGEDGLLNIVGYVAGIMFWAGLILGILGCVLLKKAWERLQNKNSNIEGKRKPSALRFFSNSHAKVVDGVMIAGFAGVLFSLVNINLNEWLVIIFLVMMLAGVYGHFLVNGYIYESILNHKK